MLASHYVEVLHVHVGCVALSGTLFGTRALLRIANNPLANHGALRMLSHAIDTTLLGAAVLLTLIIHQYPITNAWLTTKLLLLVLYIGLGTIALKKARSRVERAAASAAALLVFGIIIGVALTHDPAGWLHYVRTSNQPP
jgi:uncharacterized membrane protein SirB2